VWVASAVDGRVYRINLARGRSERPVALGGGPAALAAGAGGVWVVGEEAGVLTRLEPRSGVALKSIPVGNGAAGVAVGAGAVWVANRDDGTVSRIDPATDSVTGLVRVGGTPVAIAAAEGAVWVADASGGTIARIDPGSQEVTRRVDVGGSPAALVVAEGSLWAAALAPRSSHRGGTLRYESPPFATCGCIDPAGYDGTSTPVLAAVYDGLVAYRRVQGAAGSALVADLATTVPEPADGGRTYAFRLRSGVRFSNGAPVRPEDFRASIERAIRLAPFPPPFDGLMGAEGCGPKRCDLSRGIEVDPRAQTITIHLRRPDLEFVHKLALSPAWVVPAGSPLRIAKRQPLPGTGPYRIAEFDPARGGRLVRNSVFRSWSPEARPDGFPDAIDVAISDDAAAQVDAVRDGRADAVPTSGVFGAFVPVDDLRALAVADAGSLHVAPSASVDYAFLNVREPPFDDVRVRRAINYAIDRRRIAEFVGGATMTGLACQIIPPGLPAYEPTCRYTRDPNPGGGWSRPDTAKARRLVEQSGTSGSRVEIWAFRGPVDDLVAYLRSVLRRLGYRARVHLLPGGAEYFTFVADSRNHVQLGLTAWVADFLSPSTFFQSNFTCRGLLPRSGANGNLSQFCDPRVDAAFDRAIAAQGPDANRRWAALDRYVAGAAPAVPLTTRRASVLVADRVGNVQQHLQLGPLLDQLWVR
jgi:peptide/nickel transport system substrate-binding protein